jgi:hypothetical protein
MFEITGNTFFSTYTEAKLALLSELNKSINNNLDQHLKEHIQKWIDLVKLAIDSHTNTVDFCEIPQDILNNLSPTEVNQLHDLIPTSLIQQIKESPYGMATTAVLADDHIIRAYEGTLPSMLLSEPTSKMLENVAQVSQKIRLNVNAYIRHGYDYQKVSRKFGHSPSRKKTYNFENVFKNFALHLLHHFPDRVYSGDFTLAEMNEHLISKGLSAISVDATKPDDISIEQAQAMIELGMSALKENSNLERVMYIHFAFGVSTMKVLPLFGAPTHHPIGKFANEVNERYGNIRRFQRRMRDPTEKGFQARKFFSDEVIYNSPYYRYEPAKGRSGKLDPHRVTQCYGVLKDQKVISAISENCPGAIIYPKDHAAWTPDTVAQNADPQSIVVKSYAENEAAYVSGPSGTFSILTCLQSLLVNPSHIQDQQLYLQSMLAYIVGSGLHSIHEVLGPAEYLTQIIPGYHVDMPNSETKTRAPNFNQFYDQACRNDPELQAKLERAWEQINSIASYIHDAKLNVVNHRKLFLKKLNHYDIDHHDEYIKMLAMLQQIGVLKDINFDPFVFAINNGHTKLLEHLATIDHVMTDENAAHLVVYNKVREKGDILRQQGIDDETTPYFTMDYFINPNGQSEIKIRSGFYYDLDKDDSVYHDLRKQKVNILDKLKEISIDEIDANELNFNSSGDFTRIEINPVDLKPKIEQANQTSSTIDLKENNRESSLNVNTEVESELQEEEEEVIIADDLPEYHTDEDDVFDEDSESSEEIHIADNLAEYQSDDESFIDDDEEDLEEKSQAVKSTSEARPVETGTNPMSLPSAKRHLLVFHDITKQHTHVGESISWYQSKEKKENIKNAENSNLEDEHSDHPTKHT